MNPRIQELMTEAGIDVERLRMHPGGWPREDLLVLEDFAQLIVRECCDIFVELRTRPADLAVLDVKKHFGVES